MALQIHIAPHLPTVLADATQVEQALLNLCTNAIHAIGTAKGTVRVDALPLRPDTALCDRLGIPAEGRCDELTLAKAAGLEGAAGSLCAGNERKGCPGGLERSQRLREAQQHFLATAPTGNDADLRFDQTDGKLGVRLYGSGMQGDFRATAQRQ